MGGGNNYKQKKSSSLFNMFKSKRPQKGEAVSGISDDFVKAYRVYPSDEDRGRWVAEPGIDRKASVYIATIQEHWNRAAVSNYT